MTNDPKVKLLEQKARLLAIMESSDTDDDPVELDQTRMGRLSRMDALQGQAMAQETRRRREVELKRIEAALERIASGDYGYCVTCEEKIADKRLELDPSTPTCIDCASK
ncbi:TraR/DksA family transcriptional regulator [Sneathiella limimaris]|uniref:TraR/DksA family transcriptional regulator n=1 Tax=Sneathiella limimaris TaxID=1964213 RepID=UPI0019D069ED|nr:TraR/DksA C4-type zinc finger protein [Sneathiella limimaris]